MGTDFFMSGRPELWAPFMQPKLTKVDWHELPDEKDNLECAVYGPTKILIECMLVDWKDKEYVQKFEFPVGLTQFATLLYNYLLTLLEEEKQNPQRLRLKAERLRKSLLDDEH